MMIAAVVAACAYRPGADDPVSRKFTWFSYVNGDDLRAACVPGTPARYRFVYNGFYLKQVRTYDIAASPSGAGGWVLQARVIGPPDLSAVTVDVPVPSPYRTGESLMAPWAGTTAKTTLSAKDLDALDAALAAGGFFRPAPAGLRLNSDEFYWTGVACIDGRVTFNAYKWPSAAFDRAKFPALLAGWDGTEIPFNPPHDTSLDEIGAYGDVQKRETTRFTLTVGDNGLAGHTTLF
jgi:hypothetical protein